MTAESLGRIEGLRLENQARLIREESLLNSLRQLTPEERAQAIPTAMQTTLREEVKGGANGQADGVMLGLAARVTALKKVSESLEKEAQVAVQTGIDNANKSRPYFTAKRKLEELQRFGQVLDMKIHSERTEIDLPKTTLVEVIDKAIPGYRPVRPNKPLNIALGILVGGLVGAFLGTFIFLLQRHSYRQSFGPHVRLHFPPAVRAIGHVTVALVVGLVVGYNCATPLEFGSLLTIVLALFLGGSTCAYIELAIPHTLTPTSSSADPR
jgi:hypothetical protein